MKKLKNIFIFLIAKRRTCIVFVLASLFLLLNSCHKYPEDPFISLRRPGKRLNGTWQFTGYKINGVDHNHDFDNFLTPFTLTNCKIEFKLQTDTWKSGSYFIFNGNGNEIAHAQGTVQFGGAQFDIESKSIDFVADSAFYGHLLRGHQSGMCQCIENADWEIRELFKDNLHLSLNGADIYLKRQ